MSIRLQCDSPPLDITKPALVVFGSHGHKAYYAVFAINLVGCGFSSNSNVQVTFQRP